MRFRVIIMAWCVFVGLVTVASLLYWNVVAEPNTSEPDEWQRWFNYLVSFFSISTPFVALFSIMFIFKQHRENINQLEALHKESLKSLEETRQSEHDERLFERMRLIEIDKIKIANKWLFNAEMSLKIMTIIRSGYLKGLKNNDRIFIIDLAREMGNNLVDVEFIEYDVNELSFIKIDRGLSTRWQSLEMIFSLFSEHNSIIRNCVKRVEYREEFRSSIPPNGEENLDEWLKVVSPSLVAYFFQSCEQAFCDVERHSNNLWDFLGDFQAILKININYNYLLDNDIKIKDVTIQAHTIEVLKTKNPKIYWKDVKKKLKLGKNSMRYEDYKKR